MSDKERLLLEGYEQYYQKRKKKLTVSKVTKMADSAFSLYIRKKEPFCSCCGSVEQLQCGHLFSRVFIALRWEEDNAATQCARCNMNHEHHSEPFRRVMVTRLGEERIEELWNKRLSGQTKAIDRLRIAEEYYRKAEEL